MRRFALFFLLMALLPACATKVEGLYVKDDFKAPQIEQGKMAIGGVVAEPGKFDLQLSSDYSNLVLSSFQTERKYLTVDSFSAFFNAVGESQYTAIMNKYVKAGLDEATLGQISGKLTGTRYLAFAKIDVNTTIKGETETDGREYKNDKGEKVREPGRVTKMHTREIVVSMHIYDLKSKSLAFSGQVTKSRRNSSVYDKNIITDVVAVVNAVKGKDNEEIYPTPAAPQVREVLSDVFVGFGENLPKKE